MFMGPLEARRGLGACKATGRRYHDGALHYQITEVIRALIP